MTWRLACFERSRHEAFHQHGVLSPVLLSSRLLCGIEASAYSIATSHLIVRKAFSCKHVRIILIESAPADWLMSHVCQYLSCRRLSAIAERSSPPSRKSLFLVSFWHHPHHEAEKERRKGLVCLNRHLFIFCRILIQGPSTQLLTAKSQAKNQKRKQAIMFLISSPLSLRPKNQT